jgi:putative ABC transport system permease protein
MFSLENKTNLLNKRLARSLWGTRIRLTAVTGMIFVGVFAGITFGGYAANLGPMYDSIYEDSESGTNLADLWIDNSSTIWSSDEVESLCSEINSSWPSNSEELDGCEGRLVLSGAMFHNNKTGNHVINSVWHGIPPDSEINKIWFPEGYSEGASSFSETDIVIDAHVKEALSLELQDVVSIGIGEGSMNFTIVGFAYHPMHIYMAPEGSLFPPESGKFVVGYLSEIGMQRLTGLPLGSANNVMLDIEGTPSFDLSDTEEYEGDDMDVFKESVITSLEETGLDGRIRDRGQVESVELMRQDLEGAKKMAAPFTVLIQFIAAITIALSLQRLVQSQTREIAILRTLGVPRKSIMSGYLIAPLVIGSYGCVLGVLSGPIGMNAMLDFYEGIVGLPIIDRDIPNDVYLSTIGITMLIVFISGVYPAFKATTIEPLEVLSGNSEIRMGSELLRNITSWMPTLMGLSLRSSLRKPHRLLMTFLAIGISLMLAGSIQMMSVGLTDTIVDGLKDGQTWDAQVYVQPDSEGSVIEWAEENGASYEIIIEAPTGTFIDSSDLQRNFILVGLGGFKDGESMRETNLIEGFNPIPGLSLVQVLMDEGSLEMSGWDVGEKRTISISGNDVEVEIVGSVRGEFARTMFFFQTDLAEIMGINATAIYLDLPEGIAVDEELGEISSGVQERNTMIRGIEVLLEQQTQIFTAIMGLGVLFTLAVMFNTMVMNIAERDFELATLRVLGASTKSLTIMLLFESLLIGLIGGLFGILFAFGGAVGLAASFSTWQFYFPVVLIPSVAYQLMAIVLVIAVAMVPIGIWRLRNMDLIEKVKDLS